MRAFLMTIAALAGMACGPSTNGSSEAGGGSGTSTTEGDGSTGNGGPTTSANTSADTTGADATGAETSSADTTDTGEFGELLPAEAVITRATCDDNDIMSILIEGYFDTQVDTCMTPPDVPIENVLRIVIDPWSQGAESIEVTPGGPAEVLYGFEPMVGTLDLTIWAPGHPDTLILDVTSGPTTLQGTIELPPCTVVLDDCFPPGG